MITRVKGTQDFLDLTLFNFLINTTKKHLDLYYNRILQLHYHGASPDTVNLLFDLNPNNSSFALEKGEILQAKNAVTGIEDYFQTDHDLLITTAAIKQLNTVYVSNNVKIPAKDDIYSDVKEMQVFVASNPIYDPGDFLAGRNNTVTWPLVGEDQSELSVEERSMEAADMGLFIASPLLYAKDGKRNFRIRFYISRKSAQLFVEHVDNYAHVSGVNQKVLIYEMLSKAFTVHITGEEGWLQIKKYTASFDPEQGTDNFIEFDFELNHTDPSTGIYQPEIHGFEYHTEWPIIRFLINNNSFHNPYTFLKDIYLQRVAIRLTVTDSEHLKMRNNIGAVSASSPFQLFGPQANVGSYLDIKNANIFNCYTRNFTIRLNWFDLPRDKGGFETYYHSYKPEMKNESFRISISGLNEGRFQPVLDDQQSFRLFAMGDEPGKKNLLSPLTVIRNIDFSKIHFDNMPSFSQEDENTEADFKEGAVRLEFIAPAEGFGQKSYPTLFSETIIHNSKRFNRKMPIPNPPYAAVVRRISVDYVLEHSEAISGMNKETEKHQNLFLWHHDPFGYKRIYPGSDVNDMSFVPVIRDQSNLLIGLQGVPENQVLTMLFQIEESNFSNSGYEAEPLQWCILQDNKWQPLSKSDVLLDDTLNFINSGIVRLFIPDLTDKKNTIMDPSCVWIKASCNNRSDIRTRIQAIFTQCTSATRILSTDDVTAQDLRLAPGSIREFQRKVPQVLNVWQPFSSFGGQAKETEEKYYVRVSERLRHKQRPLTATDIAQLVLQAFPDILKVYCYGVGNNNNVVLSGCDVQVIVIPKQDETAALVTEEPKVPLAGLYKIRKLIADNISPFIKMDVANPVYERIKVVCSVTFSKSYSKASVGNNISKLNNDLRKFISPWLYNADSEVKMGGRTYLSEILNFIKNCPYVSHVTSFSVLHFYNSYNTLTGRYDSHVIDSASETISYLKGSIPSAILISAPQHDITVLEEKIYMKPEATGIGGLVIAEEFLVDVPQTMDNDADKTGSKTDNEEEYDFYFNPNA